MILEVEMHGSKIRYQEIPKDSTEKLEYSAIQIIWVSQILERHPQLSWPLLPLHLPYLALVQAASIPTERGGWLEGSQLPTSPKFIITTKYHIIIQLFSTSGNSRKYECGSNPCSPKCPAILSQKLIPITWNSCVMPCRGIPGLSKHGETYDT